MGEQDQKSQLNNAHRARRAPRLPQKKKELARGRRRFLVSRKVELSPSTKKEGKKGLTINKKHKLQIPVKKKKEERCRNAL